MTASRTNILAALEQVLDAASDKHMEEMNTALVAYNQTYGTRRAAMPTFLREMLDTLESECGYRYALDNAKDVAIEISDISSPEFNTALADMQDAMGVSDGGFASIYFDGEGFKDFWRNSKPEIRRLSINEYCKQQAEIG